MREDTVFSMVCTLYATFGKSAPSRGSAVFQAIYDRISDISDESAEYITEHIQDADTLPVNLGKAILAQYFNWQGENGIKVERSYCRECQGKGGWETIRDHPLFPGKPHFAWAPCPVCSSHLIPFGKQGRNRKQLEESGAWVVPPNYPGGRSEYMAKFGLYGAKSVEDPAMVKSVREAQRRMNHQTGYARDYMQADPQKAPREQGRL